MSSESFKLSGVQRLLEASLVVSCLLALFLLLCLFTFNEADPGWSQTGYATNIRNLGGPVGAYLSDLLLNLFGGIAFGLPFIIAIVGWLLFQRFYHLMQLDYLTLGLKIIGFILLFMGISALSSMNFNDIYYFSAGGIVGEVISNGLLPYLSFVGTTLLFLTFVLSGFVLLTGISWILIIDKVGEYTIKAIMLIAALPAIIGSKFGSSEVKTNTAKPDSDDVLIQSVAEKSAKQDKSLNNKLGTNNDSSLVPDVKTVSSYQEDEEFVMPDFSIDHDVGEDSFNNDIGDDVNDLVIKQEPFIDIDELMDGPIEVNVQEHVNDDEITAAFENVAPINIPTEKAIQDSAVHKNNDLNSLPSFDLLDRPDKKENPITPEELEQVGTLVEAKLLEYGVKADVVGVFPGPVITRFELDLAPGVKASKITGLSTDLARSLSAKSVRVVEVIEGKSVIGIELPNKFRETVFFSSVLANEGFTNSKSPLTMAIGSDISGDPVFADLAKMPHLLVAGTTGSGKSVAINTMIVSILYKSTPEDVRMIMIDPKQVELSVYEGIPHLLSPVVTDMKEAANALRWCVGEMERRYQLMSKLGVRNLKGYNVKVQEAIDAGEPLIDPLWQPSDAFTQTPPLLEKLPAIVIIVDEFADMMMIVGKKVEELIARIAQKARAAGIHLILATQRPSADVITGLIKANIPTRMALRVQSRIESRIILDQQGAEQLLGMGDMFYLAPGEALPIRVHGAFVDDHEVHAVVKDWKDRAEPDYLDEILSGDVEGEILLPGEESENAGDNELDALYDEALAFITETRRVSISSIQRKFRIGYNRAARIVEDMESQGVVSTPGNNGAREVLAPPPIKG